MTRFGCSFVERRPDVILETQPKGYDPWRFAMDMDLLNSDYPFAATALQGKHAFVCGASKGIGQATAKMLARLVPTSPCAPETATLSRRCVKNWGAWAADDIKP